MRNLNLRNITNSFRDVHLVSLASWRLAGEIGPHDRGGPYMVTQEGFDPADPKVTADEFVLGRSGQWLSLSHFFRMPVAERRAEFIFATAAEVIEMMENLPSEVVLLRPGGKTAPAPALPEPDEMAAAYEAGRRPASSPAMEIKNCNGPGTAAELPAARPTPT